MASRAFAHAIDAQEKDLGLLARYEELGPMTWKSIIDHFGLTLRENAASAKVEQARLYSKDASRTDFFRPDIVKKQAEANSGLRDALNRIASPSFANLIQDWGAR